MHPKIRFIKKNMRNKYQNVIPVDFSGANQVLDAHRIWRMHAEAASLDQRVDGEDESDMFWQKSRSELVPDTLYWCPASQLIVATLTLPRAETPPAVPSAGAPARGRLTPRCLDLSSPPSPPQRHPPRCGAAVRPW